MAFYQALLENLTKSILWLFKETNPHAGFLFLQSEEVDSETMLISVTSLKGDLLGRQLQLVLGSFFHSKQFTNTIFNNDYYKKKLCQFWKFVFRLYFPATISEIFQYPFELCETIRQFREFYSNTFGLINNALSMT